MRLAGLLVLLAWLVAAVAEPQPPCGTAPAPDYGPAGAPRFQVWSARSGAVPWSPPACTGWSGDRFALVVAVAGRLPGRDAAALLQRFGAISAMRGMAYWSVTDGRWRPLVTAAAALDGPDPQHQRADFSASELAAGTEHYFLEDDSRSSGHVVYRLRVLEANPDHIVLSIDNASRIRLLFLTLFAPGELKTVHLLTRLGPDEWGYYGLSGAPTSARGEAVGHEGSYVNRAIAFYRYLAGIPTDRDPPAVR